jgi:UPF0176 protein
MFHIAFYRFVALKDAWAAAKIVRELAKDLQGSVIVAKTGINGALAGDGAALDAFEQGLQAHPVLESAFVGMRFQRTACQRAPFGRLKISVKPDLVQIGLTDMIHPSAPQPAKANVLNPQQWDELLQTDQVYLIDNRNRFEYALGHFDQALNPEVDLYADFSGVLQRELPNIRAQNKKIAMYCTGGIRCEKTGEWLASQGIESYQLDGGILNYLRARQSSVDAPNNRAGLWFGHCFVFDNRTALDASLKPIDLSLEQVYPDAEDQWRLERAKRLMDAGDA